MSNVNSKHLHSAYYMPKTILNPLSTLTSFNCVKTLRGRLPLSLALYRQTTETQYS